MVSEEVSDTPEQLENEDKKSPFKKVIGINFIIFFIYYVMALMMLKLGRQGMSGNYGFFLLYLYPIQVIINFLAGVVLAIKRDGMRSGAYFLSAFIILIVGFGSCFFAFIGAF